METAQISIAKDFSVTPSGRYRTDGDYSGEAFREDVLVPALKRADKVSINLDGTRGYPSSFLEEAFGGLVRENKWGYDEFASKIVIVYSPQYSIYYDDIVSYVKDSASQ